MNASNSPYCYIRTTLTWVLELVTYGSLKSVNFEVRGFPVS